MKEIVLLMSVIIASLGSDLENESEDLQLSQREEDSYRNVGFTHCGEPYQVSWETSCSCLKTLYQGNRCTYSDAIENPFGKKCKAGKLEYCCNYMYRLAKKKACTSFPY